MWVKGGRKRRPGPEDYDGPMPAYYRVEDGPVPAYYRSKPYDYAYYESSSIYRSAVLGFGK
eukprot:3938223-Rhodomonas_salina.1